MNESLDSQYPQFVRVILSENVHCNQNCHGNAKPSGAITMIGKTPQQNTKPTISMSQSKSSTATIGQKLPLSNARKNVSILRTTSRKSKPVISTRENTKRIKRSHDNFDYNAHFRTRSLLQTADTGNQEIRSSGFSSVLSSLSRYTTLYLNSAYRLTRISRRRCSWLDSAIDISLSFTSPEPLQ
jgi:hypothetical protein